MADLVQVYDHRGRAVTAVRVAWQDQSGANVYTWRTDDDVAPKHFTKAEAETFVTQINSDRDVQRMGHQMHIREI